MIEDLLIVLVGVILLVFNLQLGQFAQWFQRKVFRLKYDLVLFRIPYFIVGILAVIFGLISIAGQLM